MMYLWGIRGGDASAEMQITVFLSWITLRRLRNVSLFTCQYVPGSPGLANLVMLVSTRVPTEWMMISIELMRCECLFEFMVSPITDFTQELRGEPKGNPLRFITQTSACLEERNLARYPPTQPAPPTTRIFLPASIPPTQLNNIRANILIAHLLDYYYNIDKYCPLRFRAPFPITPLVLINRSRQ